MEHNPNASLLPDMPGGDLQKFSGGGLNGNINNNQENILENMNEIEENEDIEGVEDIEDMDNMDNVDNMDEIQEGGDMEEAEQEAEQETEQEAEEEQEEVQEEEIDEQYTKEDILEAISEIINEDNTGLTVNDIINNIDLNNVLINDISNISINEILNSTNPADLNITNIPTEDLAEAMVSTEETQSGGGFILFKNTELTNKDLNKYLKCDNCTDTISILNTFELDPEGNIKFKDGVEDTVVNNIFNIFIDQEEFRNTIIDIMIEKQKIEFKEKLTEAMNEKREEAKATKAQQAQSQGTAAPTTKKEKLKNILIKIGKILKRNKKQTVP